MPKPESADSPIELTLYGRVYCHLCTDMAVRLDQLAEELGFSYVCIDVDEDPELESKYNELVPVLMLGDLQVCHHFLDEKALRSVL